MIASSARWWAGTITSRTASPLLMTKLEKRSAPTDAAAAFITLPTCAKGFCGMRANIHFSSSGRFGSLNVAALPIRSPRCFAARSQ